jgi:hypothetical protein
MTAASYPGERVDPQQQVIDYYRRLESRLVNALAAVEAHRHRAVWRYNIVTAGKPHPSDAV